MAYLTFSVWGIPSIPLWQTLTILLLPGSFSRAAIMHLLLPAQNRIPLRSLTILPEIIISSWCWMKGPRNRKITARNMVVLESPEVELGNDTLLPPGETLVLDAGEHAAWQWSTGETTQTIEISWSGYLYGNRHQ